jgi:hypothetical protein
MKGIDIAWARPDTDGIKATGAKWVARYFSDDPTKNLTADEVTAYTAAGLPVVTVWEYTAGAALEGRDKGVQDASQAYSQQKAVGLPKDMPIYFAVDTDAEWPQAEQYFAGVASVIGVDYVGVYGGIKVIEGAHAAGYKYLWQTSAWSNGQWSPYATIRQDGGTVLSGGADVDDSEVADFGQYPQEIDLPLNAEDLANVKAAAVAAIQEERGVIVADTIFWLANALKGTVPENAPAVDAWSINTIHEFFNGLKPVATPTPAAVAPTVPTT